MTLRELKDALGRWHTIYDDYEIEVFAHDGYVADCPRGTWFDAPIAGIETNTDVWPHKLRLVVES